MVFRPKVFISHKNEDSLLARNIGDRLKYHHGISIYLDVIDDRLSQDGEDLAEYIRDRLEECTQLLAVMTRKTQVSWWVPWEIGVATEKRRFLASYVDLPAEVPEYLRKWPYLRNTLDLDVYAQQSKKSEISINEGLRFRSSAGVMNDQFKIFHSSLKKNLGQ